MTFFENDSDRVKAKICGVTTWDQAQDIVDLGADALGFNFYPKSKRYVLPNSESIAWMRDLAGTITRVGVFVNPAREEIEGAFASEIIDFAQLHGTESPEFLVELSRAGLPVFKALGVKSRETLEIAEGYSECAENALLLDAYAPVEFGGTGETMDWALGRDAIVRWPDRRVILAGGLVAENVADAIAQVRPFAVDTASGVESGIPGIKDMKKVQAFLEATK